MISPLKQNVSSLKNRYDRSVTNFFSFFRFIFLLSFFMSLGFLYLCIVHIIDYISVGTNVSELCDTFYPCAFYYGRFNSDERLAYSLTLFLFALISFFLTVYSWLSFDQKQQKYNLFQKDDIVLARILFNSWDWRGDTLFNAND